MAVDLHDTGAPGLLMWLQGWYTSMCDGDWEQDKGITLETLDNPGWKLAVALEGTSLQDKPFNRVQVDRDEHDWVRAWTGNGLFEAACGPTNLSEALYIFRQWVSS